MWITWEELFNIIERITALNQADIAKLLGVSASTISRTIKGETKKPAYIIDNIYSKLFDTSYDKSPFCNKREDSLLSSLKETIEDVGLKEKLGDLWKEKGYKAFVMGMLQSTKNTAKKKTSNEINEINEIWRTDRGKEVDVNNCLWNQAHDEKLLNEINFMKLSYSRNSDKQTNRVKLAKM